MEQLKTIIEENNYLKSIGMSDTAALDMISKCEDFIYTKYEDGYSDGSYS